MWQTNSWLVPFGCRVDGERVKPVGPHVGTCVCAPATLSLKISCQLGKQHQFSEGLKVIASPLKKEDSNVSDTWPRPQFTVLVHAVSLEVGSSGLMEVGWMNSYVANAHTTHSPTDGLHIPLWPRHLWEIYWQEVRQLPKVVGLFLELPWNEIISKVDSLGSLLLSPSLLRGHNMCAHALALEKVVLPARQFQTDLIWNSLYVQDRRETVRADTRFPFALLYLCFHGVTYMGLNNEN